jgi:type I restriction enzyme S subunit
MEHVEAHTMRLLGTVPARSMKSSAVHFQPGDVLYGRLRPYLNKVYRPEFEGLCSAEFIVLPQNDRIHGKYLQYFLNSTEFVSYASHLNEGDRPRVDFRQLSSYPFPLAPLDQQKHIVAEIEKQFSRLDEAVANLKRVKANLKRYKAAILKAAVEGKLTEEWRRKHPGIEPASETLDRVLAERQGQVRHRKDGFLPPEGDMPVEAPLGWAVCSIDQIAECLDAKRVPVNKAERAKRGGNFPYYGANGQVGVIDDFIFDEPLILVVEDETFTGRTQAFSYLIEGKSWVNNHAHVLRPTRAVKVKYLNYALAYYPFTPRTTGSTGRRKLTQRGLMTAPLLLPPLSEQEQIVAEVERRLSVIEELEAGNETDGTRSERLRQSILAQAFCQSE